MKITAYTSALLLCFFVCTIQCYSQTQDLNTLVFKLNKSQDNQEKVMLLKELGAYYQTQAAHQKAGEYFQQAINLQEKIGNNAKQIADTRKALAYNLMQQKEYTKAISQYENIAQHYQQNADKQGQVEVFQKLTYLYKITNDYKKAIQTAQSVLNIYQQSNNTNEIIGSYNNIGYLYQLIGNNTESIAHYQKAIDFSLQQAEKQQNLNKKATIFTNIGVTYSHLQDFKKANQYFTNALNLYEKTDDVENQAHAQNYLAANYYVNGKNDLAISTALRAIELAMPTNYENALIESYQILAEAYQRDNDFKESQKYAKLQQQLKDKMSEKEKDTQQQIMNKQINIEKKENELKQLIAEQEKQTLALKQSELEREKQEQAIKLQEKELKLKENELLILKRNQELQNASLRQQNLEKERVEQLLEITRQKSIAEKERLIADKQTLEASRQKLLTEKERIEREKEQKAREASEGAQKAQKKQLEDEKSLRWYSIFVIGLIGIVTVLVIIGLLNARRTSKKLLAKTQEIQIQKEEIESQNEELHQNQEEILAQRDFIEQKNVELEIYNRQTRSSINAAMMIQQAILPYQAKMQAVLENYFLIFRPKDIVSGDFFWLDVVQDRKILVVADCTGHGVPGAFMTLIGNTVLDKIIHVLHIVEPNAILTHLHTEIKNILRQEATQNNSGMDANIATWQAKDENEVSLVWAGAKQDLYYMPKGTKKIQKLKATRRAIGGEQNEKILFQSHNLILQKGSLIFSGSDGLADQNDNARKRMGEEKIIDVLEQNIDKDLVQQQEALTKALEDHMMGTAQRDDILWVGVQI